MKGKKDQSIESLANEANKTLAFNKYLNKKIEIYKKYINLAKETLKKCFSDINKGSYDDILNAYINEIQKDYNTLKDDYEKKYFQNYQSLLDECLSDITMGKPILNECRANKFSLEYLKIKSEDIINGLKKSIKQSKEFHLFREPKRDSLIDTKKSDKEIEKIKIVNKYLKKKLEIYQKYIFLTKDTMTKCLSAKNNSSYDIFNTYINEIQKDNDFLKDDYEKKYYPKYQSLLDECFNDMSMGKPVLEQYQNEEFSLDYLKIKSEDIITGLKKSIKQSKEFHLFREPKRDVLIDFKKGDKEIVKTTTELQQNMLYECKKCNKFCNRIEKYNNQIKIINKNIEILKKYLNNENSKNQNDNKSIKNTDNNNIPDIN